MMPTATRMMPAKVEAFMRSPPARDVGGSPPRRLQYPASLYYPDQHHHDRDDQQDVDESPHGVAAHQPQKPQHDQDHGQGPQHGIPLSLEEGIVRAPLPGAAGRNIAVQGGPDVAGLNLNLVARRGFRKTAGR